MTYGATAADARAKVEALALRVLADRREHGEPVPEIEGLFEAARAFGEQRGQSGFWERCSYRLASEPAFGLIYHALPHDHPDLVSAFHDRDGIGPRMLARIARRTGLCPEDL